MKAIAVIRFLTRATGTGFFLVGFGPVILLAWLCYFASKDAEEFSDQELLSESMDSLTADQHCRSPVPTKFGSTKFVVEGQCVPDCIFFTASIR